MTALTEDQAREVLSARQSPAAHPQLYRAERHDLGWVFKWSGDPTRTPFGVRIWVVTDSGQAGMVDLGEKPDAALARLAG